MSSEKRQAVALPNDCDIAEPCAACRICRQGATRRRRYPSSAVSLLTLSTLRLRNASAQVPVILLGVLGVDSRYQGSGLGRMLLHDASLRALSISDSLGAKALVVDPVDGGAEDFYARHGFERIPGLERMFVPLSQPGR